MTPDQTPVYFKRQRHSGILEARARYKGKQYGLAVSLTRKYDSRIQKFKAEMILIMSRAFEGRDLEDEYQARKTATA